MTTLTVRIDNDLADILEKFCKEEDRSKSWFLKKFLKEGLEERMDYKAAVKALEEHENSGSKTHSIESVAKEFGVVLKKTKKS
ncbi:MAG: ribbon-helix-helix protein, CopG family [Proteobacteria bacterium]|nr:ribbon-helix-helix protein, CopG family [Pseudomonadota bacterium]